MSVRDPGTALVVVPRLPWSAGSDPASRFLAAQGDGSQAAHRSGLKQIAALMGFGDFRLVPWHAITLTVADAIVAKVRANYRLRTCNRMFAALRGVLDVCRAERWLLAPEDEGGGRVSQRDHFIDLCSRMKSKKPKGKKHGRVITDEEMKKLYASCASDGVRGARDAAMFALALGAGLRREEIADIRGMDIHESGRVDVVAGKGDKDRTTALPPRLMRVVERWRSFRLDCDEEPLFVRISGDVISDTPIGARAIWEAMMARREAAGVAKFTPHDARRTFITRQRRHGTSLGILKTAAGHESTETTAGYDLAEVDEMIEAIQAVDVPFGDDES